jgi:hypothetical protein
LKKVYDKPVRFILPITSKWTESQLTEVARHRFFVWHNQNLPLEKGDGYMAWKWTRISLESRMVSWYKNEIGQAGVSN